MKFVDTLRRRAEEVSQTGHYGWAASLDSATDRITALEQECDRLAAELAERERRAIDAQSECIEWRLRAEEAEAVLGRDAIREAVEAAYLGWCEAFGYDAAEFEGDVDDESDGLPERIIEALAHPSPAAQAIGRVLEAVAKLATEAPAREWMGIDDLMDGVLEAYEQLQALRAGAGEGET